MRNTNTLYFPPSVHSTGTRFCRAFFAAPRLLELFGRFDDPEACLDYLAKEAVK